LLITRAATCVSSSPSSAGHFDNTAAIYVPIHNILFLQWMKNCAA
jgi:hypothetical protein